MTEIAEFLGRCIENAGGAAQAERPGCLEVILPPALMGAAGGASFVRLALSSEALADGVEPAMLGSPFLDALVDHAASHGTVASGHLPAGRLKRKGLREEVERTLLFSGCRTRYADDDPTLLRTAIAQFNFRVTVFTEERRDRLQVVLVDLNSNRACMALAARLHEFQIRDDADVTLPEAPVAPIEQAYDTACRTLRRMVDGDAERTQVWVGKRFAVEYARVHDYYDQLIGELERRQARKQRLAGDRTAGGDRVEGAAMPDDASSPRTPEAVALALKIAAVVQERERKLMELGETYRVRTRARLASVRCLWQAKVFFKMHLDRGAVTRALTLVYDPLLERLEPPACDGCHEEATRFRCDVQARLLCTACAGG